MLLPDVEQLVSAYLRTRDEITDLVGDRVLTALPNDPTWPLLLVRRIGGQPVGSHPLWHDRALLQLDAYGGPKKLAHTVGETARMVLADDEFIGMHEIDGEPVGVVSGVEFGVFRWLPDADFTPAHPRYVLDLAVHVHPQPLLS